MSVPFFQTETEVVYKNVRSMTDYVCSIGKKRVAVSVTRAFAYKGNIKIDKARRLITKKVQGKSAKLL